MPFFVENSMLFFEIIKKSNVSYNQLILFIIIQKLNDGKSESNGEKAKEIDELDIFEVEKKIKELQVKHKQLKKKIKPKFFCLYSRLYHRGL